jgi:hypothetical protein
MQAKHDLILLTASSTLPLFFVCFRSLDGGLVVVAFGLPAVLPGLNFFGAIEELPAQLLDDVGGIEGDLMVCGAQPLDDVDHWFRLFIRPEQTTSPTKNPSALPPAAMAKKIHPQVIPFPPGRRAPSA